MAELPTTREFQVQVANAPNAPMPQVSFGERQAAGLEYRAQAQFQGTMGDVLDRMTRTVFGMANEMSQRAGLQFSAENPLTPEQLTAMAKGDMSTVQLGSPLNVFNSAVRKARAIELSGHAEIEGRDKLMTLVSAAGRGEISTQEVRDQITALTNGYSQSIAKVDPEASYKFRASMGAVGGRVIEKTAEVEAQRRVLANKVKLDRDYSNMQKAVELAVTTKMPIDEATGKEIPVDAFVDALKQNFINNAVAIVGPAGAASFIGRINEDMATTKINSVAQYISTDPQFSKDPNAVQRLLRGDAGSATNAYQSLLPDDKAKVIAAYMTADAQNYTLQKRRQEAGAESNRRNFTNLFVQYSTEEDPAAKTALKAKMLQHPALTYDQAKELVSPPKSSESGMIIVDGLIRNGQITTEEELYAAGNQYRVYDADLGKKFDVYRSMYGSVNGTYIKNKTRQAAGIPEGLVQVDPKSEYGKAMLAVEDEFMAAQRVALQEGKPFDAKKAIDDIAKSRLDRRESAEVRAYKEQLTPYSERVGYPITSQNIDALELLVKQGKAPRASGKAPITEKQLSTIRNLLKQIEGN
jgi:hypothetical protein